MLKWAFFSLVDICYRFVWQQPKVQIAFTDEQTTANLLLTQYLDNTKCSKIRKKCAILGKVALITIVSKMKINGRLWISFEQSSSAKGHDIWAMKKKFQKPWIFFLFCAICPILEHMCYFQLVYGGDDWGDKIFWTGVLGAWWGSTYIIDQMLFFYVCFEKKTLNFPPKNNEIVQLA